MRVGLSLGIYLLISPGMLRKSFSMQKNDEVKVLSNVELDLKSRDILNPRWGISV